MFLLSWISKVIIIFLIIYPGFFFLKIDHLYFAILYFFFSGYVWALLEIRFFESPKTESKAITWIRR
jgi:hypothetical protein